MHPPWRPGQAGAFPPRRLPLRRRSRLPAVVLGAAVAGLALVAGVSGCSSFDKALGQQQAIVSFKDGTSDAARLAVRSACGNLPDVTPAPLPSGEPAAQSLSEVVFQLNGASTADEARLQECLSKYSSVDGINFQDETDLGG